MKRCIEWLMGFFAVLMLALFLNWSGLVSMAARHDLLEYANVVRQSHLSLEEKERVLDLTDKLQDELRANSRVGVLRWQEADDAIRLLLAGDIDEDDVRLIERELRRIEKEISHDR